MLSEVDETTLSDICKIGQGESCCRYLVCGSAGLECAKNDAILKRIIDAGIQAGTFNANGDNCVGLAL